MPQVGFKPVIPATKRLQTYALDCVATGIGNKFCIVKDNGHTYNVCLNHYFIL
jgi:hypothetical protein